MPRLVAGPHHSVVVLGETSPVCCHEHRTKRLIPGRERLLRELDAAS